MVRSALLVAMWSTMLSTAAAQLPPVPEPAAAEDRPEPKIFVAEPHFDMGEVLEGETRAAHWVIENRGAAPLTIERTSASCGCTVVRLTEAEKIIPPGGSVKLQAEFNSTGRAGEQSKFVTVFSNDPSQPELRLDFSARLKHFYELRPANVVNLRSIRRGEATTETIDILPATGHRVVELLALEPAPDSPLNFRQETLETPEGRGVRIHMTVDSRLSLGQLTTHVTLKMRIDGIERQRVMPIRGEVVGDLTWTPRTVDATRLPARRGQQFAPVTVQATNKVEFDIVQASASPLFDVKVEQVDGAKTRTSYRVLLTLRDDVPEGPFGTTLELHTTLLDEPVVRIPVFGIVAPLVEIDPPMVLLRQDDTPAGTRRRIKLQVLPQSRLEVSNIACSLDAVKAEIDAEASARYHHLRYLDVRLMSKVPPGTTEGVLTLTTNVAGAERVEIPVSIQVTER